MTRLRYFAYGSNLSTPRLTRRVPSARPLAVARLPAHRLHFHLRGGDGSAKCDAYFTGRAEDGVWGMVWEIAPAHKPRLDKAEGLGYSYDEAHVRVKTTRGDELEVFTYRARAGRIAHGLVPYDWYRDFVLSGAREHGLPGMLTGWLAELRVRRDPNPLRAAHNRRILRGENA